ncbi:MAG: glycoside hydrolase family 95 protein, partial [Prolixibacteraceae bacterium]|nr:glycoside hydrolase family 95 protein [Prolixibacteraceae bacterium]
MNNFRNIVLIPLFYLFVLHNAWAQQNGKLKMWYEKPAKVWNEALPIGNGRLAAMVFGDPVNEKLQLNEST